MARKRSILYLTNKGLQLASKSKIKNRKEYSSVTKDGESRMPLTLFCWSSRKIGLPGRVRIS